MAVEHQPLVMPKDIPTVAELVTQSSLTPKQEDRLRAFAHIVRESTESWSQIKGGNKWYWVSKLPDGTQKTNFEITEVWVNRMNHMAFNMYESEFYPDPKLKTFADAILRSNEIIKHANDVSDEKLNGMWDN